MTPRRTASTRNILRCHATAHEGRRTISRTRRCFTTLGRMRIRWKATSATTPSRCEYTAAMRSHLPALALTSLLLLGVALRDRFTTTAGSRDTTTWGATDPTWSPDGTRIAFTVFGSIWQVDAKGGEAVQVTASGGYHAHPSWSPRGDRIAFIRGNVPAGP